MFKPQKITIKRSQNYEWTIESKTHFLITGLRW